MKFTTNETTSSYHLNPDEKQELTHWLDRVVMATEPEDVTGSIFVDNFVDDDKLLRLSSGTVTAVMRRLPYRNKTLTDVVIEGDEIFETNAEKGIYFNVTVPQLGQGYPTYEAMFVHDSFSDPRYSRRMYASFIPPHEEDTIYRLDINRSILPSIDSKTWSDTIRYDIPAGNELVGVTMITDPDDYRQGQGWFRPLQDKDLAINGLSHHVRFMSEVTGISAPEFLR